MKPPSAEYFIVTEQEFPYGLVCVRCHREIPVGTPYQDVIVEPGNLDSVASVAPESAAESIETFRDAVAGAGIAHTVCVYCVGGENSAERRAT